MTSTSQVVMGTARLRLGSSRWYTVSCAIWRPSIWGEKGRITHFNPRLLSTRHT